MRAFLQRNKLGKFSDAARSEPDLESESQQEAAEKIKVGDRCEVESGDLDGLVKRGTVKYVGTVEFKPGYWVGVQYDEPLGKHDGT